METTKKEIDFFAQVIEDIETAGIDADEVVYVKSDGSWEYGPGGCQPSNTFCVSSVDLNSMELWEIADHLEEWATR
jgi:hypothetical protein